MAGVKALLAHLPAYGDYLQDSWPEFIIKFERICSVYGVKDDRMTALLLLALRDKATGSAGSQLYSFNNHVQSYQAYNKTKLYLDNVG